MIISPQQRNIELKYETDQFGLTGELQRSKYDEQKGGWVDSVESVDVLAQIMVEVTFSERSKLILLDHILSSWWRERLMMRSK